MNHKRIVAIINGLTSKQFSPGVSIANQGIWPAPTYLAVYYADYFSLFGEDKRRRTGYRRGKYYGHSVTTEYIKTKFCYINNLVWVFGTAKRRKRKNRS